jgi:hypothetical protein
MPRPGHFAPQNDPVPFTWEAGWAPGRIWAGAENFVPTEIPSPGRAAPSEWLKVYLFYLLLVPAVVRPSTDPYMHLSDHPQIHICIYPYIDPSTYNAEYSFSYPVTGVLRVRSLGRDLSTSYCVCVCVRARVCVSRSVVQREHVRLNARSYMLEVYDIWCRKVKRCANLELCYKRILILMC